MVLHALFYKDEVKDINELEEIKKLVVVSKGA
jgi:hypothetical protein